jgi:hypothetical protein
LARKASIKIEVGNYYRTNAFPAEWRGKPKVLNALPSLINIKTRPQHFPDSITLLTGAKYPFLQPACYHSAYRTLF